MFLFEKEREEPEKMNKERSGDSSHSLAFEITYIIFLSWLISFIMISKAVRRI